MVGIIVCFVDIGVVLYEYLGNIWMRFVFFLKFLIVVVVFFVFSEDYFFIIEVWIDGILKGKKLNGNFYLKGKGDLIFLLFDFEEMVEKLK